MYVAAKAIQSAKIYSGHPIGRSKIFINSESGRKKKELYATHNDAKSVYLEKLLREMVQKYKERRNDVRYLSTEEQKGTEEKIRTIIKGNHLERHRIITDGYRPSSYFCMFLGSEPEAANNPNSKPILTSLQALRIINAYIADEDHLVLREHPHMLNGSKKYTWQDKDSYDLSRGSSFFGSLQSRKNILCDTSNRSRTRIRELLRNNKHGGDVTYEACTLGIPILDLSSFRREAMLGYDNYYTLENIEDFFTKTKSIGEREDHSERLKNHLIEKVYFNTFVLRPAIEKGPKIQEEYADHCSAADMIAKIFENGL